MFVAHVLYEGERGARAAIYEVLEVATVGDVTLIRFWATEKLRSMYSWEVLFDTREEAAAWAADRIDAVVATMVAQAAEIRQRATVSV